MLPRLERPALLIVDMQVGFVSPTGAYARAGRPLLNDCHLSSNIAGLREGFRRAGLPRLYTAYRYRADGGDYPARLHRVLPRAYLGRSEPIFTADSAEAEIVPELAPAPDEPIVYKSRYSGFFGTDLSDRLARDGVRSVVVTGVLSHVCVDSTARDAFARDLDVVVVRDAVAGVDDELHRAALRNIEETVGAVVASFEILPAIARSANA
ncbi:MAG: isochorismatase family cysteine hydrolase [Thermoplasmata archaeon]